MLSQLVLLFSILVLTVASPLPEKYNNSDLSYEVPQTLLIQMNKVETIEQLMEEFVKQDTDLEKGYLFEGSKEPSRSTEPSIKRQAKTLSFQDIAKPAACIPEPKVINLVELIKDPTVLVYPMCTRIPRCGGCCTSALLECQAIESTNISVKVLIFRLKDPKASFFRYDEIRSLTLQQHQKCGCQCKVKPSDCTEKQVFDKDKCSCICPNTDDMIRCNHPLKYWDNLRCECRCRKEVECSTGNIFDHELCMCISANTTPRFYPEIDLFKRTSSMEPTESVSRSDSKEDTFLQTKPVSMGESDHYNAAMTRSGYVGAFPIDH